MDYKDTIALPQTAFAMKAQLPAREPDWLAKWAAEDLFGQLLEARKDAPRFLLHDGPPYANGHIHLGHAFNKILKDVINRSHSMLGKQVHYVPGWDCHGLPIEWKIEEKYRAAGKNKDAVPINEFRQECRAFAEQWVVAQSKEFQRLGVLGDWDKPYTTMTFEAEARIVEELLKFLMNGLLYQGQRPVMWSVVEKTALAEAEVEYHDHVSTQIDVAFPVISTPWDDLRDAYVVIWTTTPWTLPGNRAIAYGTEIGYSLIEVREIGEKSGAEVGMKLLMADQLIGETLDRSGITDYEILAQMKGSALDGVVCAHPLRGQGYEFDVPLLPGDHVTTAAGSGFVHTAPGHGEEDFVLGQQFGLEVPYTVMDDGIYAETVPLFAGIHVYKADGPVLGALTEQGALLGASKFEHSYPHSWRSKAPLIFRTTPQWFIAMDQMGDQAGDLRQTALSQIDKVRWAPMSGYTRIREMLETRPDWVISRQRAWGVPITLFVHRGTGALLKDETVNARIVAAFREGGADVWFDGDPRRFLQPDYDPADYTAVTDILDVWFDSGCTHAFVMEDREELAPPADLYLEGSDQHRGWFQSSLLESCGTRGVSPYKAVLTHGMVLDKDGRKMSKSLGNVIEPAKIMDQYGADILRLWVMSTDFVHDVRLGDEIIKGTVDAYRKIRNTLRFLLGNLHDFDERERLPLEQMPQLELWMLHRLNALDALVRETADNFQFVRLYQALYQFCAVDLSAVYFDIRKDALYCDGRTSLRRRAARTVMDEIFSCLTAWLAPILCFTAEEAWRTRFPDAGSVHLRLSPKTPEDWYYPAIAAKWDKVLKIRRVITGALEVERREKRIGASLEAAVTVHTDDILLLTAMRGLDLAELSITSAWRISEDPPPKGAFAIEEIPDVAVVCAPAWGEKCARCWQLRDDLGTDPEHPRLCGRCTEAVYTLASDQAAQ